MGEYEDLKLRQTARLKGEIRVLSEIDRDQSTTVEINGRKMEFDVEILIREKEEELESVSVYYERLVEIETEIIQKNEMIQALENEDSESVDLFMKGIKFTFNKDKLLNQLVSEREKLLQELNEHIEYLETGKRAI